MSFDSGCHHSTEDNKHARRHVFKKGEITCTGKRAWHRVKGGADMEGSLGKPRNKLLGTDSVVQC